MSANYVVNSDFGSTSTDPQVLNDQLSEAEGYVDLLAATQPVVRPATDTLHSLSITGSPTGGSFALSVAGITTAVLPYNATYSQVSSALNVALGSGIAYVVGGPLPFNEIYVGYGGSLQATYVPAGSVVASILTGDPAATISFAMSAPGGGVGRRFNLSQLRVDGIKAVKRAVCAQAQYMMDMDDGIFNGAQFTRVKGPDFQTEGRLPAIAPRAKRELSLIGQALATTRAK